MGLLDFIGSASGYTTIEVPSFSTLSLRRELGVAVIYVKGLFKLNSLGNS